MSKERARNRAAREKEAGIKAAARGAQQERQEREQAAKKKPAGPHTKAAQPARKGRAGTPAKATKQAHPHAPVSKKRTHAPVGKPDGPLARRRRARIRLLLVLLLLVNVAAWMVWPDWSARLAVLIVTLITAPLLGALMLRRR